MSASSDSAVPVSLHEITADTVRAVVDLTVHPSQTGFVATNAISLAQALFSPETWYRAIYWADHLAGFVMLYDEALRPQPPAKPQIGLWRLMVDRRFLAVGENGAYRLRYSTGEEPVAYA